MRKECFLRKFPDRGLKKAIFRIFFWLNTNNSEKYGGSKKQVFRYLNRGVSPLNDCSSSNNSE
jgi:hypothetical protein